MRAQRPKICRSAAIGEPEGTSTCAARRRRARPADAGHPVALGLPEHRRGGRCCSSCSRGISSSSGWRSRRPDNGRRHRIQRPDHRARTAAREPGAPRPASSSPPARRIHWHRRVHGEPQTGDQRKHLHQRREPGGVDQQQRPEAVGEQHQRQAAAEARGAWQFDAGSRTSSGSSSGAAPPGEQHQQHHRQRERNEDRTSGERRAQRLRTASDDIGNIPKAGTAAPAETAMGTGASLAPTGAGPAGTERSTGGLRQRRPRRGIAGI